MDREKVIKGLETCRTRVNCKECPYAYDKRANDSYCEAVLHNDALSMLKEQEPVLLENQHKPYGISTNANSPWISRCPRCNKKVEGKQTRFCKYCGQAVKWE